MDNKLGGSGKFSKKLSEKLSKNLDRTKSFPEKIEAGEDNSSNILHKARFLRGHTCRNSEIWLKARETVGYSGLDPITRYDSDSLGLQGRLNSHLWEILHSPGKKDVSIRMFSPASLKAARSADDKDDSCPKKEFEELSELKQSLATVRIATRLIYPWNLAIECIDFFLHSVGWGERDVVDKSARLTFLADFIDDALSFNAEAWDDGKEFIQHQELSTKWVRETCLKFPRSGPKIDNTRQKKNFQKPALKNQKLRFPPGICRRYNFNMCPQQNSNTCPAPWDATKQLAHQCAYQNQNDKSYCLKNHPFVDHK